VYAQVNFIFMQPRNGQSSTVLLLELTAAGMLSPAFYFGLTGTAISRQLSPDFNSALKWDEFLG
jgi:hypothetical protein